ncbi:alpha/beta fold hydrolase [Aquibacillus kalidii]|uniref:alpha/beta fold hydrolase n=1 Tax=Aquibacillus kalidii TaxID=2762597 RepID=UPI001647C38A|nr:alpha/beta hydrolase [Aquibacillus kalidii]
MEILQKEVQVGNYKLSYRTAGSGEETIVLLHGIPTNSFLWIHVIPQLAQHYTVIAPDMLGFGHSDRASHEELTLPKQAEHVISLLDALNVGEVHVAGHDLGGGVAQLLAVNFPTRITSFMVIDGVTFSNWPLPKVVALRYPTASEFEPSIFFIERMIREGLYHQELFTPELIQAFTLPFSHPNGPNELKEASLALNHHQTEDIVPDLAKLNMPATFLYGEYDRYLPAYWGLRLQETVPNSTFKVLPECSHYSMLDNPLLVSKEILQHLKSSQA